MLCGISINEFWDYTFGEITLVIKTYNDKRKIEQQEQALNTYILADLIGASVARLLSKDSKYPPIHKVFPNLFEEPKNKNDLDLEKTKAFLMKYAEANNKKRGEYSK